MKVTDNIEITNEDNIILMARYPDNYFDLSIVDPPYGIGEDGGKCRTRGSKKTNGVKKNWDSSVPDVNYFIELQRVSKNQIIWGGNYFADLLPSSRCWLYWQKNMGGDFADGELAWTSFDKVLKQYTKRSETFNRIHPTQKPIELYKWILDKYSKEGDKILDTHLGSGSIAIACHDYKFDLTACELDKEYYDAAVKRIKNHVGQTKLF
jgi:site-specific DNA-methyltransferase (adenine-specific)